MREVKVKVNQLGTSRMSKCYVTLPYYRQSKVDQNKFFPCLSRFLITIINTISFSVYLSSAPCLSSILSM